MKKVFALVAAIVLMGLSIAAQANVFNLGGGFTNLETVTVGNVNNVADTLTGYGSVGYNYNIGKYEVTAGQYTDFLNNKAKTDDYGLYNSGMWTDPMGCKIERSGTDGQYTYSVAGSFANRPVNYVSFWDSCRFANWLGNGQGVGSTETGAYTLTDGGIADNTITRNAGAKWAVTSENEWYKAAYYRGGNTNAGYWNFPTSTNTTPGNDITDGSHNNANYYTGYGSYPIDSGMYTTVVRQFHGSASPSGTFDQGGNVWEWNESITDGAYRDVRGGSFVMSYYFLQSSARVDFYPTEEDSNFGFRVSEVASVPEPSSLIALGALVAPLLAFRRRSGK